MAAEKRVELRVGEQAAGTRLDQGLVRVDGRMQRKRHLVTAGELIEVELAARQPPAPVSDVSFEVAYEDDYLLVVDKPAGLVVHPAKGNWTGTLAQALGGRVAGGDQPWRAGIVHRLDRDTSGLLVVAKRDGVHSALKGLIASRALRREYLALVDGHPPARSGTVDAPIGRHRTDRVLMSIDTDAPRDARTHFEIERLLPAAAMLRVVLETGRTHQIRVHMAAIGHPVCGDRQYGVADRYGLRRQFLHATRLAFEHPVSGKLVDVTSPLPDDLAAALERASEP